MEGKQNRLRTLAWAVVLFGFFASWTQAGTMKKQKMDMSPEKTMEMASEEEKTDMSMAGEKTETSMEGEKKEMAGKQMHGMSEEKGAMSDTTMPMNEKKMEAKEMHDMPMKK